MEDQIRQDSRDDSEERTPQAFPEPSKQSEFFGRLRSYTGCTWARNGRLGQGSGLIVVLINPDRADQEHRGEPLEHPSQETSSRQGPFAALIPSRLATDRARFGSEILASATVRAWAARDDDQGRRPAAARFFREPEGFAEHSLDAISGPRPCESSFFDAEIPSRQYSRPFPDAVGRSSTRRENGFLPLECQPEHGRVADPFMRPETGRGMHGLPIDQGMGLSGGRLSISGRETAPGREVGSLEGRDPRRTRCQRASKAQHGRCEKVPQPSKIAAARPIRARSSGFKSARSRSGRRSFGPPWAGLSVHRHLAPGSRSRGLSKRLGEVVEVLLSGLHLVAESQDHPRWPAMLIPRSRC